MNQPQIAKLGHVALVTPDLEKSVWFFRDVIGLEEVERRNQSVYLRAWGEFEHHSLVLIPGDHARVDHIGWRAQRPEDVAAFADILRQQGVAVDRVDRDEEAGQGRAIRFFLPSRHRFEIYYDISKPGAPEDKRSRLKNQVYKSWRQGASPRRIDHVNLWTSMDPGPIHEWLQSNMGFKMREYIRLNNGMVAGGWMSVTPLVHDVAVMFDVLQKGPNRFHHVAYWLDNWQDVLRALDILRENGIMPDLGPGKHGISQAFFCYVRDPGSGHRLELFSGSYLIFDPDWQPVEWKEDELVDGLIWWGEQYRPGSGAALDETTEA